MAFTIKQIKAKLQEFGVPAENLDKAAEELCAAHKTDLDAIKEQRDTYKTDSETLEKVQKELDALKAAGDGGLQKQLEELQKKYEDAETAHKTELEGLQKQISDRAYTDAMSEAVKAANDGKGVKFTSKGAETSFMSALREKALELKDGKLDKDGFDAFLKAQKEADPDAFASDTPAPRFAARIGAGGAPDNTPANVAQAKAMGAAKAQTLKASSDVFSHYT